MVSFLVSIGVLILGYFTYGKFIEKLFGVDENRWAPAIRLADGVDYMPLPTWRIFLIFVGTVFLMGPAKIIDGMTENALGVWIWVGIILVYYILSTLLPIDKVIGKLYPVFGVAMLLMAVGLLIPLGNYHIPELVPANIGNMTTDPEATPLFPILFVTIACGAISGFHASQSPLMGDTNKKPRKFNFRTSKFALST
ncbi:MAG TPA: carbon starvation CstA family protein [Pricia sp.]|nr:carbon starvation CstA family protein [Pricia sp.]